GTFWPACLLATFTCAAFLFNVYPRPVFVSMALFTVTLTLLLEAERTGRHQLLYWFPLIFAVWANSHIQFIHGVLLLGLFVAAQICLEIAARFSFASDVLPRPSLNRQKLVLIFAACFLATCVGPYLYHPYLVAFGYATAKFPYTYIHEFQALGFRNYTDFVQLLLTLLAFFVLGRRKMFDPFLLAVLTFGSIFGFRTQRDAWLICIPAAACLAR